ncbi:MAG TPA: SLATT domain-containing protein [Streptosporangiaceae bacterium]|nr:SLATT domain-containing protein [Streptosporangiaceae bacterium]
MKTAPESTEQLLDDWYRRARESQFAHYEAARPLARANYELGVPVVALSAVVATSVFATFQAAASPVYRITVGLITAGIAVLSALQTFLRFDERAEKHRAAGGQYGALRRELEQARAGGPPYDAQVITTVRQKFDSISDQAPEITRRVWTRTETLLTNRDHGDGATA